MKVEATSGKRRIWVAWGVTIGELLLIGGAALVFSRYWLMLPIRMRWSGALILALAALVVLFRLWKFYRSRKTGVLKKDPTEERVA